jgi:hypothetical protein
MKRNVLRIVCSIAIGCVVASAALSQGRGRGVGLGRRSDVFVNNQNGRFDRFDRRGGNLSWKCGKFVNCHDARNGRWDGRGPRMNRGFYRNGVFIPSGSRVAFRNFNRRDLRRSERLNRIEMLRQERLAERRRFGRRP